MPASPSLLLSFIPIDRRLALARGQGLPDRAIGSALVADVSGFTPLTEALAVALGPQRGAEELTRHLNTVYGALIGEVERFGGSVVSFSGDSVTCWFDQDPGLRAVAAGLAMQAAMQALPAIALAGGDPLRPALKVALAHGAVRRFAVGDPQTQRLDILAGGLLATLGAVQAGTERGEVALPEATARQLGPMLRIAAERRAPGADHLVVVAGGLSQPVAPRPWPSLPDPQLSEADLRPWLLPAVYERLRGGGGDFLADLRPAAALFVNFGGIDYDDDDDAGLLLEAYVRSVQATLARHEGFLLNLSIGDKGSYLLGVIGAPVAHADDAARAVAAALELRAPPAQLGYVGPVRIGLAQGPMYSGAYGCEDRRTYGLQGDKTNLAARLMEQAAPGEILCDEDVFRQARRRWDFDTLPPRRVKGKAGLIRVYRPTGRPATPAGDAESAGGARLVGRADERLQVEHVLDELAAGRGGLVSVTGEAGIGKSRLVDELARLARARGFSGLIGAGQRIEQQTAYRAWRDILLSFFDLDEVGEAAERRARVERVSQELIPKMLARLPLLNDILALGLADTPLTAALDAALRQESLVGLVLALLRMWARERPLILVFEDADWLDTLSWQLIQQTAQALFMEARPLLLVLVSRGREAPSPGAPVVAALRELAPATALDLGALAPDETVALVTQRLGLPPGSLPDPVAALVRERSGGNPFFAEELAYSLRDRGVIRIEPSPDGAAPVRCVVSGDLTEARALPDTLHGLILARLDRLPAEHQFTLKLAAVIGRRFGYPVLADTLRRFGAVTEAALMEHLEALAQAELIGLEAPAPEQHYQFKHLVIHEVTYATLLFAQRQPIHQAVAEWYAERWRAAQAGSPTGGRAAHPGAEYLPILVYHTHHAEAWQQERRYARLAGEQAARLYANTDAVQYLSRARELTPETEHEERFDLLLAREVVYELLGARDRQADDLEQLRLASEALDAVRQAAVILRRANLAYQTGDYPAVVVAAQQAVERAAQAGLAEPEARGHLLWSMALWQQANLAEAQARNEQALAIARRAGLAQLEADSVRQQGVVLDAQGDFAGARATFEAALALYAAAQDRRGEARGLNSLGVAAYNQEDYPAANAYLARSLHLKHEIGDRYGQGITLQNLGIVANDQGEWLEAQRCFQAALDLCREIGDREGQASALDGLGTVGLRLGDYAAARPQIEQALAISRAIGERINESSSLGILSTLHYLQGDHASALRLAEAALHIAQAVESAYYEAAAWQQVGQARLGLGLAADAAAAYGKALGLYAGLGKPRFSIEPLAGLAQAALALGDTAPAVDHVRALLELVASERVRATDVSAEAFLGAYRVLAAAGDPLAEAVLRQGQSLLQSRADQIPDPRARERFLNEVPWNRELRLARPPAA